MTPEGLDRLKLDEGFRQFVYDDASGQQILRGPDGGWPTIGFGRNLVARGLSLLESAQLLDNDIESSTCKLIAALPWFASANPVWQDVMLMIDYNTGNVLAFVNMLNAMQANVASEAAAQLLDSKAAKEGPARYQRMADAILTQSWASTVA